MVVMYSLDLCVSYSHWHVTRQYKEFYLNTYAPEVCVELTLFPALELYQ